MEKPGGSWKNPSALRVAHNIKKGKNKDKLGWENLLGWINDKKDN